MKEVAIRMTSGGAVEVLLYDMIGRDPFLGDGISAETFRDQIRKIKGKKTLNLRINSPGGSVFEASAMLAALDGYKGRIEVDIDGVAASAASVVAMSGDLIRVATNGMLMIHNPHALVAGDARDMEQMAATLHKVRGQLLDTYERQSKAGRNQLSEWMDAETWFTGQEAVDAGLAHEVSEPVRVAAFAGLSPIMAKLKYKHPPALPEEEAAAAAWAETEARRQRWAALTEGT